MAVGGYREGSGRKSKWNHPTERMRLPAKFRAEIEEFAAMLDSGKESDSVPFSEIDQAIAEVLQTSRLSKSDRIRAGRLFDKLRQQLKNRPE